MPKDPICGMEVSPTSPLKIVHEGEEVYFCAEHCLKKFVQEHHIICDQTVACSIRPKIPWYYNKTFFVAAILSSLCGLSYALSFLVPFRNVVYMYTGAIWWAILLGLVLGGVIDYFVPREYVSVLLAGRKKRTIFNAVFLGFFMSACSHGILALAIQLHKKGAAHAAVIAFLLASPWANAPLTLMLVGFFGWVKALYIICSAVVIAVTSGFVFQWLEKLGLLEPSGHVIPVEDGFSISQDLKKRWQAYHFSSAQLKQDLQGIISGSVALGNMVLWWMFIGIGIAGVIGAYVPQDIFQKYMGASAVGMAVTLFFATIIEVCSEGSAPLAFELFRQTGAIGNSFVFLMAGVVTDYTEIGLLWHNVGRRVAIWLPIITIPQVILLGMLANAIF
jgi:uncharacterized membrane protein YraQ (UPF0718 family)/YHS domain-containing protein